MISTIFPLGLWPVPLVGVRWQSTARRDYSQNEYDIKRATFARVATKRNHALIYKKVPDFVRALRLQKSMTQADLGKRMGVSQVFIARCESGSRRVDVAEFIELTRALGLDPVKAFADLSKCP